MERIVNKVNTHALADAWDREQHQAMSSEERQRVAKTLRVRVYGADAPDVRDVGTVTIGRQPLLD